MKLASILLGFLCCLSLALGAEDSQALAVSKGKDFAFTKRYEMIPEGEYQVPGAQKFYLQRDRDPEPIFIFFSPRHCEFSLSPSEENVLVREYPSPQTYRILIINISAAEKLADEVRLSMLKNLPAVGVLDLGWLVDPASRAQTQMQATKVEPQVILLPKLLSYAPNERSFLITFDKGVILADPSRAPLYAKSFRRRYFVMDHHGMILSETKNPPQGAWWHLKAPGAKTFAN